MSALQLRDSAGTVFDAVGFASAPATFYKGTPIATPTNTASAQWAVVRRFSAGVPVNTNDGAADFALVALDGDTASHNASGTQVLGSPAPFGLRSPIFVNNFMQSTLYDATKSASTAPNLVFTGGSPTTSAYTPGTLLIRRKMTNCSGNQSAKMPAASMRRRGRLP